MSVQKVIRILILVTHLAFVVNLAYLAVMSFDTVCVGKKKIIVHVIMCALAVLYTISTWLYTEEERYDKARNCRGLI